MEDDCREPISLYFDEVADLIEQTRREKSCRVAPPARRPSCSRPAQEHGLCLRDAFLHTLAIRECIKPNKGFFRQLIAHEQRDSRSRGYGIASQNHRTRLLPGDLLLDIAMPPTHRAAEQTALANCSQVSSFVDLLICPYLIHETALPTVACIPHLSRPPERASFSEYTLRNAVIKNERKFRKDQI